MLLSPTTCAFLFFACLWLGPTPRGGKGQSKSLCSSAAAPGVCGLAMAAAAVLIGRRGSHRYCPRGAPRPSTAAETVRSECSHCLSEPQGTRSGQA